MRRAATQSDYAGDEELEKTGKLDADGKLVIQVPTQPNGRLRAS